MHTRRSAYHRGKSGIFKTLLTIYSGQVETNSSTSKLNIRQKRSSYATQA